MSKVRTMRMTIAGIAMTLAVLAMAPAAFEWAPISGPTLRASQLELNYYRTPKRGPWCEDDCDGPICCTVGAPGG